MCYSAMVTHQFRAYVKATGAQIDLAQFTDIFTNVARGERIVVPRIVEHWFAEPMNDSNAHPRTGTRHTPARPPCGSMTCSRRGRLPTPSALAQKATKAAA